MIYVMKRHWEQRCNELQRAGISKSRNNGRFRASMLDGDPKQRKEKQV